MELYKKKINIERKKIRDNEKKENEYTLKNNNLNLSSETKKNIKKKSIKYVIQIGKNRRVSNTSSSYDIKPHYGRMINPKILNDGDSRYIKTFTNTDNSSPNKSFQIIDSVSNNNKYISINDYSPMTYIDINNINPTKRNFKTIETDSSNKKKNSYKNLSFILNVNTEKSQNEISSIYNEGYNKYPDSKIMNRNSRVLKERYEISSGKEKRNRNIHAMPRIRKNNVSIQNYKIKINEENEVIDLIKEIEELQTIIKNLKKDNYNKNKEINILKNELDNFEEKRTKKIDDIFRESDNTSKLKNEYFKLLQDYDNNINDFNQLKDNYNEMVDEFNSLKTEKIKLVNNNLKLKTDYNNLKNEVNKTVDDYNKIVDDYNRLDKENKKLKNNYEKIRMREMKSEDKKEEDFNKLIEDYNQLKEEYDKLKEVNNKINLIYQKMKIMRDYMKDTTTLKMKMNY